jgi:tyrosine-protein phosphatase SIW14
MLNRHVFSCLCKTFLVVCSVAAAASPTHRQTVADTSAENAAARASFGASAEKLKLAGVSNAGKVSETLFRGAQPSAQGLAELKKLGVTTIVDLRDNSGLVAWERAQAESLGMRFVHIPVGGWSPPSDAQVAQFLKLVQENPTQKVFVHCHYGEDRTGVMVATYRIAKQNWTPEQAAAEMNSFGFHCHLYRAMKSYVREFPAKFAADPVFTSLHTSPAPR